MSGCILAAAAVSYFGETAGLDCIVRNAQSRTEPENGHKNREGDQDAHREIQREN
jgi:hypothetical protein